jgi:hypothetical protein
MVLTHQLLELIFSFGKVVDELSHSKIKLYEYE